MKNLFIIFLILVALSLTSGKVLHAARIIMTTPESASSNSEPFDVLVRLDAEGNTYGAVEGTFSFDNSLLEVESITTRSSVVPLWLSQPKVSSLVTEGTTTRLLFEGFIPGGYRGVRSPYYTGVTPGLLYIVTLIPKNNGVPRTATLHISDAKVYTWSENATSITLSNVQAETEVPTQVIAYSRVKQDLVYKDSNTLQVTVSQDPYISDDKWYVSIVEDETIRPIEKIKIAETSEYDINYVKDGDWTEVPAKLYILKNQKRNSYTHIQIFYENNTYTTWTIPPVENHLKNNSISRILVGIGTTVLLLYVLYRKKLFQKLLVKVRTLFSKRK